MSDDYRVKGSSIRSYIAGGFYAGAAELLGIEALDWEMTWDDSGARFELRWQ